MRDGAWFAELEIVSITLFKFLSFSAERLPLLYSVMQL